MLSQSNFTFFTILIYGLATFIGVLGLIFRKQKLLSWGGKLALVAFLCQTLVLILGFHKSSDGFLSFGAYLQMLAWFALLCGICAWWRLHHETILLFASPLGLILFLMSAPSLDIPIYLPRYLSIPFYALHIGSLFLSLGLLSLGCVSAIIFLFMENRIKSRKQMNGFWNDIPAITILDRINSACALCAFPLYTLGIIAGLFWAIPLYGQKITMDPKEIISIIVWILLGVLFHNRLAKNWRGRKPAVLTIIIFGLSLISIFAVNFLLTTHHGFSHS